MLLVGDRRGAMESDAEKALGYLQRAEELIKIAATIKDVKS